MSSPKDARFQRTKQALHEAFLRLIERKPLEDITIREISAEAGVHYTTFYRHIQTKEELLNDVAEDQIHQLVELTLPVVASSGKHDVHLALCRFVDEHRTLWKTLLTGGAAGAMKEELLRVCLEPATLRVPKTCSIPIPLVVKSTVVVVIEVLSWWLSEPEGTVELEGVARILDELVYSSVK